MNIRFVHVLVLITAFTIAEKSVSESKLAPRQKAAQKESAKSNERRVFAQDALDTTIDSLPIGYRGHSCNAISKKLKAANPNKDEFENSAAHAKRIEGIGSLPLYGNVAATDMLALVAFSGFTYPKYDADAGQMKIEASLWAKTVLPKPDLRSFKASIIESRISRHEKYLASNSFGKTVVVEKTMYDVCVLAFDNKNARDLSDSRIIVDFPLSPQEAKSVKDKLSVLFVGNLVAPYYTEYEHHLRPAIDSPTEFLETGDGLVMSLRQVWVFDKNTGKIYAKVSQ